MDGRRSTRCFPRCVRRGPRTATIGLSLVGLGLVLLFGGFVGPGAAFGASEDLRLEFPAEGATVPERVSFHLVVPADWAPVSAARIELSRDRWKSVEKSWDTASSRRGWTFGDREHPTHVVFCCAESLSEGTWEWRARAVGRAGESQQSRTVSFRVDGTPPAEIEDLGVRRRADGGVSLSWDPVVVDVDGKPETVDHYVVYRYEARGIFPQTTPTRLGQTRAVTYDDRSLRRASAPGSRSAAGKGSDEARTVYYKVVAVDLAGNEIGLREARPSPVAEKGGKR